MMTVQDKLEQLKTELTELENEMEAKTKNYRSKRKQLVDKINDCASQIAQSMGNSFLDPLVGKTVILRDGETYIIGNLKRWRSQDGYYLELTFTNWLELYVNSRRPERGVINYSIKRSVDIEWTKENPSGEEEYVIPNMSSSFLLNNLKLFDATDISEYPENFRESFTHLSRTLHKSLTILSPVKFSS